MVVKKKKEHLFKLAHVNVENISVHFLEFKEIFGSGEYDVVGVSESFLKPYVLSSMFSLDGYRFIRNDREGKEGGGVGLYYRDCLECKVVHMSESAYSFKPEFLACEIRHRAWKVLVVIVYRPPKCGLRNSIFEFLEDSLPQWNNVVVMGDFNIDMAGKSSDRTFLSKFMYQNNLQCLPLRKTYHRPSSSSWLDLILVSLKENVVEHGQKSVPGLSNHDLIYCVLELVVERHSQSIKIRNYSKLNEEVFNDVMSKLSWKTVYDADSIDDKVCELNKIILGIRDTFFPERTFSTKKCRKPEITPFIRGMMTLRDQSLKRFKLYPKSWTWHIFAKLRNRVKQLLRDNSLKIRNEKYANSKSGQELWKLIKADGLSRNKGFSDSIKVPLGNLNDYFCQNSSFVPSEELISTYKSLKDTHRNFLEFKLIEQFEIENVIDSMTSKAVGIDGVSICLIKWMKKGVIPALEHVYNFSLYFGEYPHTWKQSIVTPIPKIPIPSHEAHYRPINILSCLGKILDKLVYKQVQQFIDSGNYLDPYQSGYRVGHSTETALIRVCDDIRKAMDDRKITVLVLIDFSKAFDLVNHTLLLSILESFNLSDNVISWFSSYLSGRKQCVRGGNTISSMNDVTVGVPQGSTLSALLFSLFVNRVSKSWRNSKHIMYADDLQLYIHCTPSELQETVFMINNDLKSLNEWCLKHGLSINHKKCQAIVIGTRRYINALDKTNLPNIKIENTSIPYVEKCRNLGFLVDECLSWEPQVATLCRKVRDSVRKLRFSPIPLNRPLKITLVSSLIFPQIDYASSLYTTLTQTQMDKLQKAQNVCIRFIFDLRWNEHVTQYYSQIGWLKVSERFQLNATCLAYKMIKTEKPFHTYKGFRENKVKADKITRSKNIFDIPIHRTSLYSKSFLIKCMKYMNDFKEIYHHATSRKLFNKLLKENLLKKYFDTNCGNNDQR